MVNENSYRVCFGNKKAAHTKPKQKKRQKENSQPTLQSRTPFLVFFLLSFLLLLFCSPQTSSKRQTMFFPRFYEQQPDEWAGAAFSVVLDFSRFFNVMLVAFKKKKYYFHTHILHTNTTPWKTFVRRNRTPDPPCRTRRTCKTTKETFPSLLFRMDQEQKGVIFVVAA